MMRRQITLLMAVLFAVAALAATQIQDLTTKRAEEVTFSAKVAEALAAPVGGVATLTLDADYIADAAISVPVGTQLAIDGAGHTLTLGAETNFIIQDGITLKNVKVDASALTVPLIAFAKEPAIAAVESGQYVIKNPIVIDGVEVKGLTKNLIADNGKSYAYENVTISNSLFQYATQGNVVINFASSMAINFQILNSTFYSNEAGTANFIAMSGKRPWQITGYEDETGKLTVANNTFYNVAKGKQFMNTNTLKGQKYLYVFNSNIFADVSNKKIYGNMTNNKKQLTTDGKNTYLFDGAFFNETNYNGDEGLQTNPTFLLPAEGDFTVHTGSLQAKLQTGDPRWLVPYNKENAMPLDVVVDVATGAELSAAVAQAQATVDKAGVVTVNLDKDGQYTITGSITTAAGIIINGNGATVDASGLSGDMITLDGTADMVQKPDGTYDASHHYIANVTIKDVSIYGLKSSFIKDAQKTLLEKLTVENAVIEMAANKQVVNFQGKGYVGEVIFKNSTVYSSLAKHEQFFAQYGSRPKNIEGSWLQQFDIENCTFYNIAQGKNVCDFPMNSQTTNVYTLKNNIFVNVGKSGQTVVGFNKGASSTNPVWTVDGNAFNYGDADSGEAETTKAGKKDGEDIVKNNVAGVVAFADAAKGDFTQSNVTAGDPRWIGETPTAIEGVKTAEGINLENAVIYNLNGQRIDKAQAKGGVYIVNGRKVVIK